MDYNLFGEVYLDVDDIKDITLESKYADIDMTLWPGKPDEREEEKRNAKTNR